MPFVDRCEAGDGDGNRSAPRVSRDGRVRGGRISHWASFARRRVRGRRGRTFIVPVLIIARLSSVVICEGPRGNRVSDRSRRGGARGPEAGSSVLSIRRLRESTDA